MKAEIEGHKAEIGDFDWFLVVHAEKSSKGVGSQKWIELHRNQLNDFTWQRHTFLNLLMN